MMVYIRITGNANLHYGGAFFVFSVLIFGGDSAENQRFSSLAEPRGSAHAASFSLPESVIVGKTLPAEVYVSQTSIY